MAELHGTGLATVFTADTYLELWTNSATSGNSQADELPNTVLIEHLERIVGKYTTIHVIR